METEALSYYSDYNLCKKFGWTVQELLDTPHDYYSQFSLILNCVGAIRERERIRAEQKQKNNKQLHG